MVFRSVAKSFVVQRNRYRSGLVWDEADSHVFKYNVYNVCYMSIWILRKEITVRILFVDICNKILARTANNHTTGSMKCWSIWFLSKIDA